MITVITNEIDIDVEKGTSTKLPSKNIDINIDHIVIVIPHSIGTYIGLSTGESISTLNSKEDIHGLILKARIKRFER